MRAIATIVLSVCLVLSTESNAGTDLSFTKEIRTAVDRALTQVERKDATEIPEAFEQAIRSDLADYLNSDNLAPNDAHRRILPARVEDYLKNTLQQTSAPRKMTVEYGRVVAREILLNIRLALERDQPIPVAERADLIRSQCEKLVEEAKEILKRRFPNAPQDIHTKMTQMVLERVPRKMNDPFSPSAKRLLSEEEIKRIQNQWQRVEREAESGKETLFVPPGARNTVQGITRRMGHLAARLYRVWKAVYEEDIPTSIRHDSVLRELQDEYENKVEDNETSLQY